jgi:serine/threonine protein phosphatase PrpC
MKSNALKGKIGIVAKSVVGMVRKNNEDGHVCVFDINDPLNGWGGYQSKMVDDNQQPVVLILADGMGGLDMGEEASRIAVDTSKEFMFEHGKKLIQEGANIGDFFVTLFEKINKDILSFAKSHGKEGDLGTTLVISFIYENVSHIFWIGDSRCYVFRNGRLTLLSKDHSYVQELVDQGKITYEQSFYHPESNIITKYMGDPRQTPVPSYVKHQVEKGDVLMLCSDGLNGMLTDDVIEEHFFESDDVNVICQNLIDSANREGGSDNNTIIMASFGDFVSTRPAPVVKNNSSNESVRVETKVVVKTEIQYKLDKKKALYFFMAGFILAALLALGYKYRSNIMPSASKEEVADTTKVIPPVNPSVTADVKENNSAVVRVDNLNEIDKKDDVVPTKIVLKDDTKKILDQISTKVDESDGIVDSAICKQTLSNIRRMKDSSFQNKERLRIAIASQVIEQIEKNFDNKESFKDLLNQLNEDIKNNY